MYEILDFDVPTDLRVKLKKHEDRTQYLNLARELKKTMDY